MSPSVFKLTIAFLAVLLFGICVRLLPENSAFKAFFISSEKSSSLANLAATAIMAPAALLLYWLLCKNQYFGAFFVAIVSLIGARLAKRWAKTN